MMGTKRRSPSPVLEDSPWCPESVPAGLVHHQDKRASYGLWSLHPPFNNRGGSFVVCLLLCCFPNSLPREALVTLFCKCRT